MIVSGLMIAAFVIFHILHLTTGTVHPDFRHLESGVDVYANVVNGFSVWYVSLFYVIAMVLLGQHLIHGIWSMLQTLGLDFPRYNCQIKAIATVIAWLIVAGNISIPIAVLAGFIRLPGA
jgi:succinate dehydrogenase / fumarate reductase cytochrome b subunit